MRGVRIPAPLWQEFKRGCKDEGTTTSAKIRELVTDQVWKWAGPDPFGPDND